MINEVSLVGRVASTPEIAYTDNGVMRCSARLELAERRADDHDKYWRVWTPLFAYGRPAETLCEMAVGDAIAIRGKLQWQREGEGQKGGVCVQALSVTTFELPPELMPWQSRAS